MQLGRRIKILQTSEVYNWKISGKNEKKTKRNSWYPNFQGRLATRKSRKEHGKKTKKQCTALHKTAETVEQKMQTRKVWTRSKATKKSKESYKRQKVLWKQAPLGCKKWTVKIKINNSYAEIFRFFKIFHSFFICRSWQRSKKSLRNQPCIGWHIGKSKMPCSCTPKKSIIKGIKLISMFSQHESPQKAKHINRLLSSTENKWVILFWICDIAN